MTRIARAIDVGFGSTKFTLSEPGGMRDIECKMFPSVAPIAGSKDLEGFMSSRDTIPMKVGDHTFEVGPDAMLAMPSTGARTLDLDFATRDTYMALVRGAIHYMGVEEIDYLYVGLPVTSIESMGKKLEERMTGVHELPKGRVRVNKCVAVPQPVGGMWDYGVRNHMIKEMQTSTNLLIDPGYFTLDWVVTVGMKMVSVRSGAANNAGMAAILRAVGERLVNRIREREGRPADLPETSLQRMDEAIRNGTPFKFNGKHEKLDDHMPAGEKVIDDAVDKMIQKVGSLSDIDNVVIVGGAAHLYERAVRKRFPGYDVKVAKDAVFANVRGFQIMATRRRMNDAVNAA